HHFRLALADSLRIKKDHVGCHSRPNKASIGETKYRGHHEGELADPFFQPHHLIFSNPISKKSSRVAVTRMINQMRAGIRLAYQGKGTSKNLSGCELVSAA